MKKMYRILAVLLIIAFVFTATGCGGKQKTAAAPSVNSTASVTVNQTKLVDAADVSYSVNTSETLFDFDTGIDEFTFSSEAEAMPEWNTEEYNVLRENSFLKVRTSPLSTFAMDVDNGSYTNFRRMVNEGCTVPSGAVRTEEFLNYFDYTANTRPSNGRFTVTGEIHPCPWNLEHGLLSLLVSANPVQLENKGNNFVFLIDTSGSMGWTLNGRDSFTSLELAVKSFELLTAYLTQDDRVSIVTYAGASATLLNGCNGADHNRIVSVLRSLSADGGTNGGGGINAAYACAVKNYIEGGNNRVILASDGDMNLGITSQSDLVDLITQKKELGIFLTTLGFGEGNYSDANMEAIADAGNGNYFYIDCIDEANRVLVDKMMQTTVTVAKDVKLQAEFNPALVKEYRLIGYENRVMAAEDFKDDTKDGGEIGAGAQVMVLYELVWASEDGEAEETLKYQTVEVIGNTDEVLTLSIRFKEPDADVSAQEDYIIAKPGESQPSTDWYFAAGIAEVTGMLHYSNYFPGASCESAIELISKGTADDSYRKEFSELVSKYFR